MIYCTILFWSQTDVANKLREKENVLLTRINKVHNVAPVPNAPAVSTHK